MIYTENEAKKKICPIRSSAVVGQDISCEGSRCMAWMWVEPEQDNRQGCCGSVPLAQQLIETTIDHFKPY